MHEKKRRKEIKKFSRTLYTFEVHALKVTVENNKPKYEELPPVSYEKKPTEIRARRELGEKYGKEFQYIITEIKPIGTTYEMSLDVFMKHAVKISLEELEMREQKVSANKTPVQKEGK